MKLNKMFTLAALVAGSMFVGMALQAEDAAPKGKPPGGPGAHARGPGGGEMFKDLNLTDDQKAKMKANMEEMQKQMKALREDATLKEEDKRAKFKALREANQAKIKEILTPEQFEKFQKRMQEHRPMGPKGEKGGDKAPKKD
jgi:Spy/CpxP family protein refolding chaperone